MASKVKTICEEKVFPIIEELGYEVVEMFYGKQVDGNNLIFYIDNEKGITLEDCEKVTRAIDKTLEELDPTAGVSYTLSVSSPGLDRPIKSERDFKRNLEKEIEITLFSKLDGKKNFKGILKAYDDQIITIENNGKNINLERKLIANIVPIIKF